MATIYPQLTSGIAITQIRDGCVVEGGPRREVFTGRAAQELFPRLLPLLDGTRSIADIAGALRLSAEPVQRVIDRLRQRGLLHFRHSPDEHRQVATGPMSTFLRRCVPDGRGELIEHRLQATRARVTGSGPLATLIADLLDRSGVEAVERHAEPGPDGRAVPPALVVSVTGADPTFDEPDHPPEAAWIPVHRTPGEVLIGPLLNVPGAVCPRCRSAGIRDLVPASRTEPSHDAALTGVAAGIAAGVALRYLAGHRTPSRAGDLLQIVESAGSPREHVLHRRTDCPACGHPGLALTEPEIAVLAEERRTGTPRGGWDLDRLELTARDRLILSKPYLTQPRLSARVQSDRELDGLTALARLLARGVGSVRPRRPDSQPAGDRWVPSAAGGGSTHAYVLGDLAGDGPAVHYFDGASHEFVRLPARPVAGAAPPAPLSVVLTGDLPALRPEFGSASRRVAYQDAGLALAQLHACAKAAGWRTRAVLGPADDLTATLELDPERELVAATFHLDRGPPGAAAARSGDARRLPRWLRPSPMTYRFADRPVAESVVAKLTDACLSGVAEHWERVSGLDVSCLLYARRVGDLPVGLYRVAVGSAPAPVETTGADLAPIDGYLRERDCSPAALLLFTGHLPGALSEHGTAGYPALAVKAAAAAGLARLAANRAGLGSGLIARAPGSLVSATRGDRADCHRLLYSSAIGYPDPEESRARTERVAW